MRLDDELDAFIEAKMASAHIPSVSLLVQRNSTLLWKRAYGYSKLGDTIRDGKDVHSVTDARACNATYEEFLSWAKSDDAGRKDRYLRTRQMCKAVNFSVGGGARPKRLAIASRRFNVNLTIKQASDLRDIFLESFALRLISVCFN